MSIELPASTLVLGLITGFGYGLLSAGLVIVYRANRIINFAHGEIGALGAAVFVVAVERANLPYYLVLPFALAVGGAVAGLAELIVIRRLRAAPRLMSIVATLGLGQLLFIVTVTLATAAEGAGFYPPPPGLPEFKVGALLVTPAASGLLFLSPFVIAGLAFFLRKSRFGLALRSAAANPEAARMAGVYSSRMSTLAWAVGGALSTFTAILVAPNVPGGLFTAASFGPSLLMRGLTGAIIARMTSVPVALAGGVMLGVMEGLLLQNFKSGAVMDVALFGIILVALFFQLKERTREEEKGSVWAAVQPWRPLPRELSELWAVRNLSRILGVIIIAPLVIAPLWLSNVNAIAFTGLLSFVMVALSIGIVTGLSGQLTLGQFALAAVGATVSARIAVATGGNPISLLAGGLVAAAVTVIIGLPALRIKGLFLAVATLSFAVAMSSWVLTQPWALGDGISSGTPTLGGRPLQPGRDYYYFALVVFLLLFMLVRNVWRSGLGRLLRGVRDGEDAARAFGIRASVVKLQGFLIGGFVAGVGGAVYGHSFSQTSVSQFSPQAGVDVVVMTVVGGIGIVTGPLLGNVFVKGVPAFIPLQSLALFAFNAGLLLLIMFFPGGLVQLVSPLRERLIRGLGRIQGVVVENLDAPGEEEAPFLSIVPSPADKVDEISSPAGEILMATSISKSYGGLTAVDEVSLSVLHGETVGLIGPNGAGKTTLFEILAGFVRPDRGSVTFEDQDVTRWSPERRAGSGLIRSFQDVTLFPTLSVLDTVQLALQLEIPTRLAAALLGLSARDKQREALARDLVGSMGLWDYRDKQIQELSTGTRRITELACLVGLKPKLLLLDEPSSGIAQRETEALGSLLENLKSEHDMTLFIIEHDIPMIMSLADRIIAMDAGAVIASGSPDEVRNNQLVVEAYLGGKIEAIERSGRAPGNEDSELHGVRGLGPARRAALLEVFGSVEAIRRASAEELVNVPGFGPSLAQKVLRELN